MATVHRMSRRRYAQWSVTLVGGIVAAACDTVPESSGPATSSKPTVDVLLTVQPGEAINRATAALDTFNTLAETTRVRATIVQAPADNKALAAKIISGADDDIYFSESVGIDYKFQGLYKEIDSLVRTDREISWELSPHFAAHGVNIGAGDVSTQVYPQPSGTAPREFCRWIKHLALAFWWQRPYCFQDRIFDCHFDAPATPSCLECTVLVTNSEAAGH